jgi:hypothetical protein
MVVVVPPGDRRSDPEAGLYDPTLTISEIGLTNDRSRLSGFLLIIDVAPVSITCVDLVTFPNITSIPPDTRR